MIIYSRTLRCYPNIVHKINEIYTVDEDTYRSIKVFFNHSSEIFLAFHDSSIKIF